MKVIAIVGLPGSGKSEAAAVAREEGVPVLTMGDVIRAECRERGLEITEETMGTVATDLREQGGDAAVADRSLPLIEAHMAEHETVLVDGIRGIAEVERFVDAFGEAFSLVSVEVPFDTRLQRIRERGRDPTAESRADLEGRDERELGYGMGEAMNAADVTIRNTGSLEAFRTQIRTLLDEGPDALAETDSDALAETDPDALAETDSGTEAEPDL